MRRISSAVVLGLGLIGFSASARQAAFVPNINQGDVSIGGNMSASLTYNSNVPNANASVDPSSYWMFSLALPVQYFVADRFALGVNLGYTYDRTSNDANFNQVSAGPMATYFFWSSDRWASFLSASATLNYTDVTHLTSWSGSGVLGLQYFITPAVGLGPSLQYIHYFSYNIYTDRDTIGVLANFTLYL